jgi:hypothetical protein
MRQPIYIHATLARLRVPGDPLRTLMSSRSNGGWFFLDREGRLRDRGLFDSKLRVCDLVKIKIGSMVVGPERGACDRAAENWSAGSV